jgi:hypothetical protein
MWLTQIDFLWLKLSRNARKEKRNMAVAEPNLQLQKSPAEISLLLLKSLSPAAKIYFAHCSKHPS